MECKCGKGMTDFSDFSYCPHCGRLWHRSMEIWVVPSHVNQLFKLKRCETNARVALSYLTANINILDENTYPQLVKESKKVAKKLEGYIKAVNQVIEEEKI